MNIKNKKWTEEEFFKVREEVLKQWPTGEEVDLAEGVQYLKELPDHKNFAKKLWTAKQEGKTLAQPRAGVALLNEHIELLNFLSKEGGADLLPSTIDSYTRLNRYEECERGIKESEKAGRSLLNGFPGVNYGVKGCKRVLESVDKPLQVRHGTPDARLLAEITMSSGWTSYEGGGISYNLPYAKSVSMERTIRDWQYIDRLVGWYEEQGVSINREPYGPLTGTLVPVSISNAVQLIECLLAAEQGVKSITLGYGQCGNLVQDVAAIRTLQELAEEYCEKLGYKDMQLTTVFHQWMGGFPEDESKAYGVISNGACAARLSGATKVIVKTTHEAIGIPTKEANANAIKATKMVLNLLDGQTLPDSEELDKEIKQIKAEIKCIMDKVYDLGNGDLALGTIEAVKQGVIDIPFAPAKINLGKMLPARDNQGRIRYLECGNLPFTDEIKAFNKAELQKRADFEGREIGFQMTVDDIFAVGKGNLIGRPEKN
ncbi:methylaspartate mutase subunit E [Psychrilyobacter atlanticus]|uniref:methylaspartate mutase subunit E n=1 Tax=Psychrilyobacter atlanticus TaxID=271091 RepID=UPI000422A1E7|nr:methylaspartate mutase subunit E [Psychrilyobacter atlanticus]